MQYRSMYVYSIKYTHEIGVGIAVYNVYNREKGLNVIETRLTPIAALFGSTDHQTRLLCVNRVLVLRIIIIIIIITLGV